MATFFNGKYVEYPYFMKILGLFEEFIANPTKSNTPSCMLIYGEPGTGKSALAKQFLARHPRIETDMETRLPVFYFPIREEQTVKAFAANLLEALGSPPTRQKATVSSMMKDFKIKCKGLGVQFIIFDELHNLIEERGDSVIKQIAIQFKSLIDDLEVPIIFMGNTISKALLQKQPELASRIPYRYRFKRFRVKDESSFSNYCHFLDHFTEHYGFSKTIDLESYEILYRIFAFTEGELRRTEFLFTRAFEISKSKSEAATINTFAEVLCDFGFCKESNPFLQPLSDLIIREYIDEDHWHTENKYNKKSKHTLTHIDYYIDKNLNLQNLMIKKNH